MTDYLKILRLDYLDYSQRRIADSARCSRHTIRKVLEVASKANIHWPLDEDITNAELERILFPDKYQKISTYVEPDYPYIHRELAKPGVTLTLLWEEYCRFLTLRGDQSTAQIWCEIDCFNELAS